ncbi:MAG TPA: CHAT domain-containing protein, partial [Jatrophihabitans sp.]|nr:CHAT domain-containing protein [Jatrophihabitans sp.]
AFEAGEPAAAIEAIERARAASSRLVPVRQEADEHITALLAELRQAVADAREVRATAQPAEAVAERERRVGQLQRALRSRAWTATGTGTARQPARLAEVRAALTARSATLVCFVQIGDALSAIVQDQRAPRWVQLGSAAAVAELVRRLRADLDALAHGLLPAAMVEVVTGSMRHSLDRLDGLLMRPLRLGDRPLIIVPTGPLAALAWNLLPSMRARPISVAPSATAWLAADRDGARCAAPRIAAFAGPELPRSVEEIRRIGQVWGDRARISDRVEPADLVAALADSNVVHVAAHGQHQPENPLFSSIRLASGPVFAYELEQGPTVAEHVVLSACELGQATIRPGDEALGLTSVLLHLGSRSVISGVARVHDDVAAEVMPRYHQGLAGGLDSARALAEACAAQTGLPAPFVCFGASWHA